MTRIGIILGSTRPTVTASRWPNGCTTSLRAATTLNLSSPICATTRCRTSTSRFRRRWASTRRAHQAVGGKDRLVRRVRHRDAGVQPQHLRRAENAIDYLYAEWNNKAVGFVSYGSVGGARAVEHLRLVVGELQMADVRQQVAISLMTEFENFTVFKPNDYLVGALNTQLDQVVAWSTALASLRNAAVTAAA